MFYHENVMKLFMANSMYTYVFLMSPLYIIAIAIWLWHDIVLYAFRQLKQYLATAPVLAFPV